MNIELDASFVAPPPVIDSFNRDVAMISGKNTLSLLKIARVLGLTGILDSAKSTTSCNEKCGLLLSGTFVSF